MSLSPETIRKALERVRLREEIKKNCQHEWCFQFHSLDYTHYKCEKCGETSLR